MSNPQVIDDELWDHYSGLPNPMWYQHITELEDEEEGIDYCFEHYSHWDEIKDEEFHRLRMGFLQYMKEIREYVDKKVDEGENFDYYGDEELNN